LEIPMLMAMSVPPHSVHVGVFCGVFLGLLIKSIYVRPDKSKHCAADGPFRKENVGYNPGVIL
jgi:hypothetical protein